MIGGAYALSYTSLITIYTDSRYIEVCHQRAYCLGHTHAITACKCFIFYKNFSLTLTVIFFKQLGMKSIIISSLQFSTYTTTCIYLDICHINLILEYIDNNIRENTTTLIKVRQRHENMTHHHIHHHHMAVS